MKKKISFRLFFTVLWRGITQVFCFVGKLLGYKDESSYAKVIWRISATCLTALLLLFTVCFLYAFTKEVIVCKWIEPSLNPEWESEYISSHIMFQRDYRSGKTRVYDKVAEKVMLENVDWVVVSADHDSLAVFAKEGKRGYINRFTGEIAISNIYSRAWVFSEGLAAVEKDGKLQFIDHGGNVAIKDSFMPHNEQSSFVFHQGYCLLKNPVNGSLGLIDKTGSWALKPEFLNITRVDSLWVVKKRDGEMAVLDGEMRLVLPFMRGKYYIIGDEILAVMPSHVIRKYDLKGRIVEPFFVRNIEQMTYSTGELRYMVSERREDEDYISEDAACDPVNIQATAKCQRYEADYGWYGLISFDGHVITPPSFSDIIAVGSDLFLCTDENGYGILLDDKGNRIR